MIQHFIDLLSNTYSFETILLAIFLLSLVEGIAFLGLIIPGATLMIALGAMVAPSKTLFPLLIIGAALGAFVGDAISFYLGKKGMRLVPISQTESRHFLKGKRFFEKFGLWSLPLGRLLGPTRPIIPFIAGLFGMKTNQFLAVETFSALLWAVVYLCLGRFLGHFIGPIGREWRLIIILATITAVLAAALVWYRKHFKKKVPAQNAENKVN